MTNGIAVFDDVCAFGRILDEHFVTSGCILTDDHFQAVDFDDVTLLLGLQADNHAVCRINFQKCSLFHKILFVLVYIAVLR